MTREQFHDLKVGQSVIVHSFGNHAGTIAEIEPTVTIQGRTVTPRGWVKVKLPGKPEWNGTFKDVSPVDRLWRVTGTDRGIKRTVQVQATDHNSAVRKASHHPHMLVVRDCVLIDE